MCGYYFLRQSHESRQQGFGLGIKVLYLGYARVVTTSSDRAMKAANKGVGIRILYLGYACVVTTSSGRAMRAAKKGSGSRVLICGVCMCSHHFLRQRHEGRQ